MKRFILKSIRFYQRYLSLDTGHLKAFWPMGSVCRFRPTCSEYTYQAIDSYGIMTGLLMSVQRILRCHPWSKGGFDPLPDKKRRKSL